MKIHWLQHVPFEGLGCIAEWASKKGAEVSHTRFYLSEAPPAADDIDLLIVMGGPMGVYDEQKFPWLKPEKEFLKKVLRSDAKVLGMCLGAQLITECLGSRVYPNRQKEIGWFPIEFLPEADSSKIGRALATHTDVFHWHGDTFDLPAGAKHLARSDACEHQAFLIEERILGLQFHLEVTADSAKQLIQNCEHELIHAPFIQTAEQMLKDPQRFERANSVMLRCLDELTSA